MDITSPLRGLAKYSHLATSTSVNNCYILFFIFGPQQLALVVAVSLPKLFKLLLVYCYVLITSICISSVFFVCLYSSGQS